MRYEIVLAPEAIEDLAAPDSPERTSTRKAIARHLRHEPTKVSKSRIKRLRGVARPEFRLRVGDIRVIYDVAGGEVVVLAIVRKADAADCLGRFGVSE
jgi:mRNA-degrading endonuclease RelE of RelBE toxin-antitoxin system